MKKNLWVLLSVRGVLICNVPGRSRVGGPCGAHNTYQRGDQVRYINLFKKNIENKGYCYCTMLLDLMKNS